MCTLCFCTHSELSCKSLEGQEGLRQLIFQVTCNMKDVGSTIGCQRLAGRLVSTSHPLEAGKLVGSPHPREAGKLVGNPHSQEASGYPSFPGSRRLVGSPHPLEARRARSPPVRGSAPPSPPCPEAHCCARCGSGPEAPV